MAKKIELSLSKKDFETLLMHLYVGNWVLTDTLEDDQAVEKFDRYFSKFLSAAKKQGFSDLISYDKQLKDTFLNEELEETCLDAIDDYEDLNFWEALACRLAERDLDVEYEGSGIDELAMTAKQVDEKYKKYLKRADKYGKEFTAAGIDRLKLDESIPIKKEKKSGRKVAAGKKPEATAGGKSAPKEVAVPKKAGAKKIKAPKKTVVKKVAAEKAVPKKTVAVKTPVVKKAAAKKVIAKKTVEKMIVETSKTQPKKRAAIAAEPKIAPMRGPKPGPRIAPKKGAKPGAKKATTVVAKPIATAAEKIPAKRGRKPKAEKAAK